MLKKGGEVVLVGPDAGALRCVFALDQGAGRKADFNR